MSRLPLELYILVIDAAAAGRAAGAWEDGHISDWDCIKTLKACSLVCRAWYYHTIPHLWSSITVDIQSPRRGSNDQRLFIRREWWESSMSEETLPLAEVLKIFQSNCRISASVRHLCLKISSMIQPPAFIATPELLDFCKAVAPLPSFSWKVDELEDDTIFTPFYDVADDNDHQLGQIVSSLCSSATLTTFAFSGMFPFDILKAMPNLKDVSFTNVPECVKPFSYNSSPTGQSLPFCLRRARFWGAEAVYAALVASENVFSQLEELSVSSGASDDSWMEGSLAKVISLPKGTLTTLNIEISDSEAFASEFIEQDLSADSFQSIEFCSIRISDLDQLVTSQQRARLLDILEEAPAGILSRLEFFELRLSIVAVSLFATIFDPDHRAWAIAKRLLAPNAAPSLYLLSIIAEWSKSHTCMESDHDSTVNERVSSQCVEMLKRCAPVWDDDDVRDVSRFCEAAQPHCVSDFTFPPEFFVMD